MAKNKDEAKFTTYFKNRMKAHYGSKVHWFKIPDGGFGRFLIPKPYDTVVCLKGQMIALEFKYKKGLSAIGMYDLRPSQIDGLQSVVDSGGLALIIFEIKVARANYKMLTFEYTDFKAKGSIKKKELAEMVHRGVCHGQNLDFSIPFLDKAREHKLAGFFDELEFAMACR